MQRLCLTLMRVTPLPFPNLGLKFRSKKQEAHGSVETEWLKARLSWRGCRVDSPLTPSPPPFSLRSLPGPAPRLWMHPKVLDAGVWGALVCP